MAVPDTTTFTLQDVVDEITAADHDLVDCFSHAEAYKFDPVYMGSKNQLDDFRNYGAALGIYQVGFINFSTRPFYIGAQPALGTQRENHFHIFYITGSSFVETGRNITRWVCKQSDDSTMFGGSSITANFSRTARPKMIDIYDFDMQTLMTAMGLYFLFQGDAGLFKSLHNSITYAASNRLKMLFNLVAGSTALPTMSLNQSSLVFDGNLNPMDTDQFSITADGDWVIIIDNANISVNKWWGSGNDTITITVSEHDFTESNAIKVYSMANEYDGINIEVKAPGYQIDWLGYISWAFDYESSGVLTFAAFNTSSAPHAKDAQSSTLYWETRDSNNDFVEGGQVSAYLNNQQSSAPTDAVYSWGSAVSLWGQVSGGSWIQLM